MPIGPAQLDQVAKALEQFLREPPPKLRQCGIRAVSQREVAVTVRADDHGDKRRIRLDGTEFVRRLMLHVLPGGIKSLRHYGVLACACKRDKLAAARQALQMPASNPQAMESARAFMARVGTMDVLLCPTSGSYLGPHPLWCN